MSDVGGVGVSPGGNVLPIQNDSNNNENIKKLKRAIAFDRRVRVTELVLRCLIICLGVVAAVLVATDSQVKQIFSIRKRAKFTDLKALVLLVVANGIVAAYSAVQLLRCVVSMLRGTLLFNKPLAWAIFSADQLMAYLTIAAVAAPLEAGVFSKWGQAELQWMQVCGLYWKFCNQAGQGIGSAFFASIGMVILSAISSFSLFRLYHPGAAGEYKSAARW